MILSKTYLSFSTLFRYFLLYGSLILINYGCGASIRSVPLEHQFGRNYNIGETYKVSVGSTMVKIENLYLRPAFTPLFDYQPPGAGIGGIRSLGLLKAGQIWKAIAIMQDEDGYLLSNQTHDSVLGIHINLDGTVGHGWMFLNGGSVLQSYSWIKEPLFKKLSGFAEQGSFVAELIFTGLASNTVRIAYREYLDGMARPAFYQELTYDLSESKNIMFRSLKIQILEANNSYIIYSIVDDGGLPWMPTK